MKHFSLRLQMGSFQKKLKSIRKDYPARERVYQIWPKICIFGNFGPNIGIFGPFDTMPDQKTMQIRCLGGFPLVGGCGARAISRKTLFALCISCKLVNVANYLIFGVIFLP